MKIIEKGFDRYAEIKVTSVCQCQACGINFTDTEVVFYAVLDNSIVCRECASAHKEVRPRLFLGH